MVTSDELMPPLAFTSERKFVASTACPMRPLVWATSELLTVPLPLVSPTSTRIEIVTFVEPFTLLSVIWIV